MRKFLFVVALVALLGTASSAIAGGATVWELERNWQKVMEQQKRQEARWQAIERQADKLLQQENKDSVKTNGKSK